MSKLFTSLLLLLTVYGCTVKKTEQPKTGVKPISGTWINLTYQDERNKYTNPENVDNTSPELWRAKVKELSDMGVDYLVLMAVANEGRSFYPSDFMPPAYPEGKESPVEAIMNAADENNMHVFMSTGWAESQDDNLKDPKIREIQLKIMNETAQKFSNHKSFYGWYLPVEDCLEPYLPDHAVEAVNFLTGEAKRLTPNAKVMVSPYGICYADLNNKKFGEQIAQLKVDIIAYQDEVGCVREAMPLPRMKEHFKQLGEIHKNTNIEFWANNESFTWEKALNSRESALIPAAFPRLLSQMAAVSQAGVSRTISFAVCGIIDNSESSQPLGQPEHASRTYRDYMDWKAGKGRWPLLASTFCNAVNNGAEGKTVQFVTGPLSQYANGNLTDGRFGEENYTGKEWAGFGNGEMEAVIDLGKETDINAIAVRFLNYKIADIAIPSEVEFQTSKDGTSYTGAATITPEKYTNDLYDCWIDIASSDQLKEKARYVKIKAKNDNGMQIFSDEILINPQF